MAYIQMMNSTIERSPIVAAIRVDYRDNWLVKRAFDVAGREFVALWRQQREREHTLKTHIEFERSKIMLQKR